MLSATHFFEYSVIALMTLGLALISLSVFYRLVGSDLGLHSLAKEAGIAICVSLVQGAGLWFTASLVPGGLRRQIIPALIVAIIYKVTHWEDWSGYEVGGILTFQMVIWLSSAFLLTGGYQVAVIVLVMFAGSLFIIASVARGL